MLSRKAGTAYFFYSFTNNLLPNLVTALVLFYGGRLVMQGQITSGKVRSSEQRNQSSSVQFRKRREGSSTYWKLPKQQRKLPKQRSVSARLESLVFEARSL